MKNKITLKEAIRLSKKVFADKVDCLELKDGTPLRVNRYEIFEVVWAENAEFLPKDGWYKTPQGVLYKTLSKGPKLIRLNDGRTFELRCVWENSPNVH